MKPFLIIASITPGVSAFVPGPSFLPSRRYETGLEIGKDPNVQLGGNDWKPDSGGMRSTDVGDYFPDDYEQQFEFQDGMMGSQNVGGNRKGPELPGMENLGADAVMSEGIQMASEIPEGMDFTPSSVPDGEVFMQVAASGGAVTQTVSVAPVCMTFEDFYAAFAPGSHPSFSVTPPVGRMDRRGGELSNFDVTCDPRGRAGDFEGFLVINLPEDNSKITYKVTAKSY